MNYQAIFDALIHKRKVVEPLFKTEQNKGQIETHHIIMRSLGGSDDSSNLVNLTVREHYFIHELMVRIYAGTEYEESVICAWNGMSRRMGTCTKTSRLYQQLRLKYNRIAGNFTRGKIWITDGVQNKLVYPSEPMPDGFRKGLAPLTAEQLEGHKQSGIKRRGEIRATDGVIEISVFPDEIPNGFHIGKKPTSKTNKGKIFVTDGKTNLMVYSSEVPDGFYQGITSDFDRSSWLKDMHKNMSESKKRARAKKISDANRGKTSWAKGKHFSDEHKAKLRKSNIGKHRSEQQKLAISLRQKGKIKVNNGVKTIYADPNNIPPGFVRGQLHKKKKS